MSIILEQCHDLIIINISLSIQPFSSEKSSIKLNKLFLTFLFSLFTINLTNIHI